MKMESSTPDNSYDKVFYLQDADHPESVDNFILFSTRLMTLNPIFYLLASSVTRKKSPKKLPKMIDFDTLTKIAEECGRFEQINCCQRL